MNVRMQIIIVLAVLIMLTFLVRLVKKNTLSLKYAMPWMLVSVGIGICAVWTPFTSGMADFLGIQVPSNMLFFMGFCFSLALIFGMTLALSKMSLRMKRLTQEYALLEKEVYELKMCLNEMERKDQGERDE